MPPLPNDVPNVSDRARGLVTYLRELALLRSRTALDLAQYDETIFLGEIVDRPGCRCAVDDDPLEGAWIQLDRPPPPRPSPEPPRELHDWLDGEDEPALMTGAPTDLEPALIRHRSAWAKWSEVEARRQAAEAVYGTAFAINRALEREGERMELVLGVGLLEWQRAGAPIRRHLLVADARIDMDPGSGRISIGPDDDVGVARLEQDMLDASDRPPPHVADEGGVGGEPPDPDDLLRAAGIGAYLSAYVNALAPGAGYDESLAGRSSRDAVPQVSFAPALILRRRGERALIDLYADILAQLEHEPPTDGIARLVETGGTLERPAARHAGADGIPPVGDELLLPLASNDQQRQIVTRLRRDAGVVVQGPPGTGKSHAIANLVCDLLAGGKRVLITAETARALEVLKDKLPAELRGLCVDVLGDSRRSLQGLQASVLRIQTEQANFDAERSAAGIRRLADERERAGREREEVVANLVHRREAETRGFTAPSGMTGSLSEIGARLREMAREHEWLADEATTPGPPLIGSEAVELGEFLREIGPADRARAAAPLPDGDGLPAPDLLAEAVLRERRAAADEDRHVRADAEAQAQAEDLASAARQRADDAAAAAPAAGPSHDDDLPVAGAALVGLRRAVRRAAGNEFAWAASAAADCLAGRSQPWRQRADAVGALLDEIQPELPPMAGRSIRAGTGGSLETLAAEGRGLLEHLRAGGRLKGPLGLTPKPVKEAAAFLTGIELDGAPPRDAAGVELALRGLRLLDGVRRAENVWTQPPLESDVPDVRARALVAQVDALRRDVLPIADAREEILTALRPIAGLRGAAVETEADVEELAGAIERLLTEADLRRTAAELGAEAERAEAAWDTTRASAAERTWADRQARASAKEVRAAAVHGLRAAPDPDVAEVRTALEAALRGDADDYARALAALAGRAELAEGVRQADLRLDRLRAGAPRLAAALERDPQDEAWPARLAAMSAAWDFRRDEAWFADQNDPAAVDHLERRLDAAEQRRERATAQLAAARAWHHALTRMSSHESQNLAAFARKVQQIGKGTGKYAASQRREAQDFLRECQSAIPAWIMPLYRVAQTVAPERERFDVVIVDEASQAGVEALFLFHLAPQIVVVGDDEQISPERVGVDRAEVEVLKRRHLRGVALAGVMGVEDSLFDQACIRFRGRIVLREHFRCMPEIIRFSDELCYLPKQTGLVPLRQFGSDRLPPLMSVPVAGGARDARNVNRPEAERLVHEVVACHADPAYRGRSFGVISLLGRNQAQLIQTLLERDAGFGPEAFAERHMRCGDASAFQGDERDVMFLSLVAAREPDGRRPVALTRDTYRRRFNVAASRARDQLWLFSSVALEDLSEECMRHRLVAHMAGSVDDELRRPAGLPLAAELESDVVYDPFESVFEQRVYSRIAARGFHALPQFETGGFRIDLVVVGGAARLAVECDGERWHNAENHAADLDRERALRRLGWHFFRVRGGQFFRDPDAALAPLWTLLAERGIRPAGASSAAGEPVPVLRALGARRPDPIAPARIAPGRTPEAIPAHDARRRPTSLETVDLGSIPARIGALVARYGRIPHEDLPDRLAADLGLGDLPDNYARLIARLTWAAKGRGFIADAGDDWIPGARPGAPVAQLSGWTLDRLARRAHELALTITEEPALRTALARELAGSDGDISRLIDSIVDTAIRLAARRIDSPALHH